MHVVRDPLKRILSGGEVTKGRMRVRVDEAGDHGGSPGVDGPVDRARESIAYFSENTILNQDRIRFSNGVIEDPRYKSTDIFDKSGSHVGRLYQNRLANVSFMVPFIDLGPQHARVQTEIQTAIQEVIDSHQFILGPRVRRFEEHMEAFLSCPSAIGVASGSDALLLALMALDVGPSDVVLVPSFTFFSTVSCITRLGATPRFVDVEPDSCLVSPEALESTITQCRLAPNHHGLMDSRTGGTIKAIIPVHLFGHVCDMAKIAGIARSYDFSLVEDVAQAFGARTEQTCAGTIGDVGCFSFFPTKNLGAFGDAGLVATHRRDLADKLRSLRIHGEDTKYRHGLLGINSRLDAIQAAVLDVKLAHEEEWCRERIERAQYYFELFAGSGLLAGGRLTLPPQRADRLHVYNYFVIHAADRDGLKQFLNQHSIQSEVYYPIPMHLQPCLEGLGYRPGDFPNSEKAASEVLAIPLYPYMPPAHQEFVVEQIGAFYRRS